MHFKTFLLSTTLVAVSACGGGGGGDSGGGVTSPAPSVVITNANAPTVASTAGQADTITSNSTGGISFFSVSNSTQNSFNLSKFTREILHLGHSQTLQPQATDICPGGGSITYPDNPSATSGTVTFNNCTNLGITFNGSATFSISGDPAGNFSASVTYSNFSVSYGGDVSTLNATMSVTGSYASPNGTLTTNIASLEVTHYGDYVKLYNYVETLTYNDTTLDYTISWDYTFESSVIGGAVHVVTEQVISGNDTNLYPNSGIVVMTGADSARVRVTINGTGQPTDTITIDVDADGNGTYEDTTMMTWTEFDALAGI